MLSDEVLLFEVDVSSTYFGPKHMHRLARYPLEKAKRIMKAMNQPSWKK